MLEILVERVFFFKKLIVLKEGGGKEVGIEMFTKMISTVKEVCKQVLKEQKRRYHPV